MLVLMTSLIRSPGLKKKKLQGGIGKEKDGFPYNLSVILIEEYQLRELTVVQILVVWQETKIRSSSNVIIPKDHGNLRKLNASKKWELGRKSLNSCSKGSGPARQAGLIGCRNEVQFLLLSLKAGWLFQADCLRFPL